MSEDISLAEIEDLLREAGNDLSFDFEFDNILPTASVPSSSPSNHETIESTSPSVGAPSPPSTYKTTSSMQLENTSQQRERRNS